MRLRENPVIYLILKFWHYGKGNRKSIVIYALMSWIANLAHLCIPLIFVFSVNELQKNGVTENNFYYLLFLLSLFIARCLFGWSLHGPSRMIENKNSFRNRANYKTKITAGIPAF